MALGFRHGFLSSLLELFFPEHCVGCGAARGTTDWFPSGLKLDGLRLWDAPHLCAACFSSFKDGEPASRELNPGSGSAISVISAQWTNSRLVDMVGAWKYHGVRGLIWPLAEILVRRCLAEGLSGPDMVWIPIPLHGRRQRERGFNQAQMLAAQLAAVCGGDLRSDLVVRSISTRQQAQLQSAHERISNLQDAFCLDKNAPMDDLRLSRRIVVVDDIVTSGATTGALVMFLRSQGLQVEAVVSLAVARADTSGC